MDIDKLFEQYAIMSDTLESIRAELPQLEEVEKRLADIKKQIQEYAKEHGNAVGHGYEVRISERESWDTKSLAGFALAHPELNELRRTSVVATIRKKR